MRGGSRLALALSCLQHGRPNPTGADGPGMDPVPHLPARSGMCSAVHRQSQREGDLGVLSPALAPVLMVLFPAWSLRPAAPFPLLWYREVQNRLLFTRALVIINNNSAPSCSSFLSALAACHEGPVI